MGLAFSVLIRMELAAPGSQYLGNNYQLFNVLVTAHALLIVFFLVMPAIVGGFGNYLVPVLLGAPDWKPFLNISPGISHSVNVSKSKSLSPRVNKNNFCKFIPTSRHLHNGSAASSSYLNHYVAGL